jgi:integrase
VRGSLRQRRPGSWELRVHAGRDAATGKPAYVARTVRGDREVTERALAGLVAQITDSPTSPTFGTVGELCDKWWTYSSPNLAPTVAREYRRLIDRRVGPTLGHVKVVELRANQLDAWYGELLVGGAVSGRPLSANSVRHIHSVLHRALEQGIAWDWIADNPARRASPPPARRPSIHLPSADEVVRLIEASNAVNRSLPIFLRLAAVTGARRGELCALRWQHVDFHRQTLHIAGQVAHTATGTVQRPTKTHTERRLTLDPVTLAELGELGASVSMVWKIRLW